MKNGKTVVDTIAGTPESFGWQRRADLDQPGGRAWESPTGELLLSPERMPPIFVRLKNRQLPWIINDRA
jgi:hypothetical protein